MVLQMAQNEIEIHIVQPIFQEKYRALCAQNSLPNLLETEKNYHKNQCICSSQIDMQVVNMRNSNSNQWIFCLFYLKLSTVQVNKYQKFSIKSLGAAACLIYWHLLTMWINLLHNIKHMGVLLKIYRVLYLNNYNKDQQLYWSLAICYWLFNLVFQKANYL